MRLATAAAFSSLSPSTSPFSAPHATALVPLITGVPNSFAVFRPVGWLMLGLRAPAAAVELVLLLHGAGWPTSQVQRFTPRETRAELAALAQPGDCGGDSGADWSYQATLMRLYGELSGLGTGWLLVRISQPGQVDEVVRLARRCGAVLAVHYTEPDGGQVIDLLV